MAKKSNQISKVMKFRLRYIEGCGDYQNLNHELWDLQKKTREILNKTIQILYDWDFIQKNILTKQKAPQTYVYQTLSPQYPQFRSTNLSATIRKAYTKFKNSSQQIKKGEMSLPSYKASQPIVIQHSKKDNNNTFKIYFDEKSREYRMQGLIFTLKYKKEKGYNYPIFQIYDDDNTQRSILERIVNGQYNAGESQLVYDKKSWFLYLTYQFSPQFDETLDPNKILGVDMGISYAIYASSYGEWGRFSINGTEVIEKAKQMEARKKALQKQAQYCGEGRIGHGTKTRVAPAYAEGDKLARYRDTINHRYSKALIEYAMKNGYGTIQMEDLTAIKDTSKEESKEEAYEKHRLLQHWTYYDLQQKIIYKAKEHGIEVVKVDPKYTSQRCSKCGHISPLNRKTQADFKCVSCGYACNADFNASQNLSIKNIDKIIEKTTKKKPKS